MSSSAVERAESMMRALPLLVLGGTSTPSWQILKSSGYFFRGVSRLSRELSELLEGGGSLTSIESASASESLLSLSLSFPEPPAIEALFRSLAKRSREDLINFLQRHRGATLPHRTIPLLPPVQSVCSCIHWLSLLMGAVEGGDASILEWQLSEVPNAREVLCHPCPPSPPPVHGETTGGDDSRESGASCPASLLAFKALKHGHVDSLRVLRERLGVVLRFEQLRTLPWKELFEVPPSAWAKAWEEGGGVLRIRTADRANVWALAGDGPRLACALHALAEKTWKRQQERESADDGVQPEGGGSIAFLVGLAGVVREAVAFAVAAGRLETAALAVETGRRLANATILGGSGQQPPSQSQAEAQARQWLFLSLLTGETATGLQPTAVAAETGQLQCLRWLRSHTPPFSVNAETCEAAARGGSVEALALLRDVEGEKGVWMPCPWDVSLVRRAAIRGGHMGVVSFLEEKTGRLVTWGVEACEEAARSGQWAILHQALGGEQGGHVFPSLSLFKAGGGAPVLSAAVQAGKLDLLRAWAKEKEEEGGSPVSLMGGARNLLLDAVRSESCEMVKFVLKMGTRTEKEGEGEEWGIQAIGEAAAGAVKTCDFESFSVLFSALLLRRGIESSDGGLHRLAGVCRKALGEVRNIPSVLLRLVEEWGSFFFSAHEWKQRYERGVGCLLSLRCLFRQAASPTHTRTGPLQEREREEEMTPERIWLPERDCFWAFEEQNSARDPACLLNEEHVACLEKLVVEGREHRLIDLLSEWREIVRARSS
uniref:Uncharacterized protein n=1 Tax=Chromera velia CCMP2878 TaxID=1169474 RepID=A0A0G4HNW3_9ALVE|eukprot:Cvel_7686.t1-p1 / transcript=Cvel_7686.t1 / gene=Cvel_7686 / organism=Chromera_velia_CCMP2878 / gene_product=hypothetical protein / transcript_product=hypothetical protein / location=Cvel_scaffold408:12428-15207(+) / protein_length=770 / sequence_SO=supercontig / SO=protein_coding / is_pseudo=false